MIDRNDGLPPFATEARLLREREIELTRERVRTFSVDDAKAWIKEIVDARGELRDETNRMIRITADELAQDPRRTSLLSDLDRTSRQIEALKEKHQVALADAAEKGHAYEADELFMYLLGRGYGTKEYRVGRLARLGDRWLAGVIRFDSAKANYERLNDIPDWISERIGSAKDTLGGIESSLAQVEKDHTPDTEDAEARIRAMDSALERCNAAIATRNAELEKDRTFLDAASRNADHLRDEMIEAMAAWLMDHPDEIPSGSIDASTDEIARLERRMVDLEGELAQREDDLSKIERLLSNIRELKHKLAGQRWDNDEHFFRGTAATDALYEVVHGRTTVAEAWRDLASSHREETRRPTIGSSYGDRSRDRPSGGSIGEGSRGSSWSTGGSIGGDTSWSTGGGFGGDSSSSSDSSSSTGGGF